MVRTLQTLRNEEAFDLFLFWEKVINSAEAFKVEQSEVHRKRKIPSRFDDELGSMSITLNLALASEIE